MASAEWYFDFVSPFCYLQLERMHEIERRVPLELKPIVLAGVLSARGQLGPAEVPGKRRFTYRFVQWVAERDGILLRFPPTHPFNPIKALRLAIVAGNGLEPVRTIFRHLWRDGRTLDDPADWRHLCERLDVADADTRINEPNVKAELRANGVAALAAGVFGVPSFVVDGEVFWGADATGMTADFLDDPGRFASGEFARLDALPVGVERTRS